MQHPYSLLNIRLLALVLTAAATAPAWADKPSWAGGGKPEGKGEAMAEHRNAGGASRFDDEARRVIGDYYGRQSRAGKCPPGLAKKHNGCLPPGQAKQWARGNPLPADLRYYDLPRDLLRRLPPPTPEHRYVQVAGDILLIAIGTSVVIDAVEDILR